MLPFVSPGLAAEIWEAGTLHPLLFPSSLCLLSKRHFQSCVRWMWRKMSGWALHVINAPITGASEWEGQNEMGKVI